MSDSVIEFCTKCTKPKCKYGNCAELKKHIESLRKQKLLKNKGGRPKKQ